MSSVLLVVLTALSLVLVGVYAGPAPGGVPQGTTPTRKQDLQRARDVLKRYPLVDGHNDLPHQFRRRVSNQIDRVDLSRDVSSQWGPSHTDIPRLRAGLLGAQFWSVYVSCSKNKKDAVRAQLEQIDVALRFIEEYPEDFKLVTTARGIEDAFAEGRIGSLLGMEGGHAIDSSMAALRMMYRLGARYMTLTHTCTLPWVDASPEDDKDGPPTNDGLTDWGKLVIREMNRLGMIVDISHVSKATMFDVIETSLAPVIFSHSNAWELCQRSRNLQDDVLRAMAANRGIIMVTFVGVFLDCYPSNNTVADVALVADHIDHIAGVVGKDFIGIGGDYDGVSRLPIGLEDVSKYPNLFAELVRRGWTDGELEKLAGRNLVRTFRDIEMVRENMAADGVRPIDDPVPDNDLDTENQCRTDF